MLALVDANNMYCACERVFDPRLRNRPLVVLSANDGAVVARSEEAKALGVQMAQPWFQVRHLEKTKGLLAVSANFELYTDMSSRMMAVEARFAPRQEIYSIDESFLDFEGVRGDLVAIGQDLRETVLREVGLATCVGLGPTKTLAKLANHVAKSAERKPGSYPAHLARVCNVGEMSRGDLELIFSATEVGEVWGIGKRTTAKLNDAGVRTVLDFVRADAAAIRKSLSVVVEKTLLELRGTACLSIDDSPAPNKQILVSRSFGKSITSADEIVEAVSEFASRAAEKLRNQGSVAGAISVFFSTSPFRKNDRQHEANATFPLIRPSADSTLLVGTAMEGVRRLYRSGFNYAKAGVMLVDLQEADAGQQGELDLFSSVSGTAEMPRSTGRDRSKLMDAMDTLNQRFGRDSVRIGSATLVSGGSETRSWAAKRERRTPRYTTRWDEMPMVLA
ncbi:Y-family DNA polymerase [Ramlibacter solisilvae]|uniref:DNA polymerase V subunit UmuC n=1 Tax=Ramlibacter tataouinensis TaxID=94132 RepID=A0A127JW10_9BURK|nr:Y-family DNA polymerase [Ramlibacter tataouinensis]AMO24069.1 DNA polymerase V subunit UmuC [Ramlibacter tataouinensis]